VEPTPLDLRLSWLPVCSSISYPTKLTLCPEPSSIESTSTPEKPTFLTIPREIRDAIYEYLLLFDGEIIPFPTEYEVVESQSHHRLFIFQKFVCTTDWSKIYTGYETDDHEKKQQLSVALLGVCKKIQDEAATALFGRNTFRMSSGRLNLWVKGRCTTHPTRGFWSMYGQYFRHVRVTFDARDVDTTILLGGALDVQNRILYSISLVDGIDSNGEISQTAKEKIHKTRVMKLMLTFANKAILLRKMNLKTLEFDIGNVLCPSGCCRRPALERFVEEMLTSTDHSNTTYVRSWRSEQIKLIGTWNDAEKQLAGDCWGVEFDGDVGHAKENWSISSVRLKERGSVMLRRWDA